MDSFSPKDGSSLEEYMASAQYQKDLNAYDGLLGEVLDPLVRRGFVVWATPSRMREAFEATERP